jgi:hypothetical protein
MIEPMAWNPTPEVAAVRDAAQKLKSPFAVLIWLDATGKQIGVASYGQTKELCVKAGEFGEYLFKAAQQWGNKDAGIVSEEFEHRAKRAAEILCLSIEEGRAFVYAADETMQRLRDGDPKSPKTKASGFAKRQFDEMRKIAK